MPSLNTKLATAPNTTANYVLKATTSTTIGNSLIFDNGTNVGIGNTNTTYTLDVTGTGRFTGNVNIDGERLTIGGTSNNAIINNIASVRVNIDCDNNGTGESFTIGHNQVGIDNNNVLFRVQDNANTGINTGSPVTTNLVGALTIVKSYNGDTPTSTTAQAYYGTQSSLYLFGRNAGVSIISNNSEEGKIAFGNASTPIYASITTSSGTSSVGGDMYFKVGSDTERMRITSSGNVGIGTSSPQFSLALPQDSKVGWNDAASAKRGSITVNSSADAMVFATGTSDTERMRIRDTGEVLMHSTAFDSTLNGQLFGTGGDTYFTRTSGSVLYLNRNSTNGVIQVFQYNGSTTGTISTNANSLPSDLNFKKDISNISIGLDLVSKLRPVHYRHKIDDDNEPLSNGIIAQELEQSLLECGVEKNSLLMLQHKPNEKEGESQYWVDYTKMIPVLIKAIQEQQAQIDQQQQTINSLINR